VLGSTSTCCHFFHCMYFIKLNFLIQFSNMSRCGLGDAAALDTPGKKYKKKKRTGRNVKKRHQIFLDEKNKAFSRWKNFPKLWVFSTCDTFIEWCHVFRESPHYWHKLHCIADKANLHHCKRSIFKECYIQMCQHIHNIPFLEHNNCPLSVA
jgi:hypothetical protein